MTQRRSPLSPRKVPALQRVIDALKGQKGYVKEIARRSGGVLSYSWICTFAQGRMRDPGFVKVVTLARLCGLHLTWEECASISQAGDLVQKAAEKDLIRTFGARP